MTGRAIHDLIKSQAFVGYVFLNSEWDLHERFLMPSLRVMAGESMGQQFVLDRPKLIVGRHPQCEIVVPSGAVSRNHAQLVDRDGVFFVEDLQSRNGTYVNGRRITVPTKLDDGDEVRICDFILEYQDERESNDTLASGLTSRVSAIFVDEDIARTQSSITGRIGVDSDGRMQLLSASADAKLQAFLELSRSLAKSLSLEEVLPPVLDSLFKIFVQADSGFIVFTPAEGKMVPMVTRCRNEDEDSVRISRGIIQHVISRREAIISADAADDSRFSMTESIAHLQIRSFMCAPLITPEGELLGAVQIDTRDPRHGFAEKDLEIILAVASQAAVTIQNAQLHEEALEQRAMQRDLELAREVQRGLLPQARPTCLGFEFFDYYEPAHQIGGDYFDYVKLPEDCVATLVADVSGHGISAALLMTKLAAEARFCLASTVEPGQVMTRLNQLLCDDGVEDRFVTLALLVVNPRNAAVSIANAGHLSPILRHRDGRLELLSDDIKGPPLGVCPGLDYRQTVMTLAPEESLVLLTDGISEAMDSAGDQFGFERLHAAITPAANSLDALGRRVVEAVRSFVGTHAQSDDICLVAVQRELTPISVKETL
ncbi:MAG TPA: SpoIIE family protein phosphatase [Pirellulaceae bacterium]